ncbi:long-chain fatty acid--CoA ligase [Streptomyces inhibens]|uniref:Acyl-CoA synthetase n=1 Tax=Streptomyces inhibens TaxID=2293571 RepID=A0A371QAX6_STRIH|nr:AMP-dependent synthetase/ligase [Streptomyces inhibens]REK91812.1 long-chain fatty acid--CoA ligase [Streptomyces inhibens]
MTSLNSPTVAQLPVLAAQAYGDRRALRFKRDGAWHTLSYRQLGAAVEQIAAGLHRIGVRPGDRVGLLSETRHEWTLCDLAIARTGAVCVPVYPTSSPEECAWVLGHSGARTVIAENAAKAAVAAALPGVEAVVVIEAAEPYLALEELRRGSTPQELAAVEAATAAVEPDSLATVVYTSGTTGQPKGCMITHGNWRAAFTAIGALLKGLDADEEVFVHLPLAHVMSRSVQLVALEHGAGLAYFGGDMRNVVAELSEVRPTILPSVPRLFEKAYAVARDLPPETVAQAFGGRLRLAVTGAAPIAPEIQEFFASCGIPIHDTYGMTESTALVAANLPGAVRPGTVGRPLPGAQIRIAPDGEILARGAGIFAGYLDNPKATAQTVVDGWLHTGDLGRLDADGYLTVTGRKKDIIITATGKNVTPAHLENNLRRLPWISQAVLLGDRRPYPVLLLTFDAEAVLSWAAQRGLPPDLTELARHREVRAAVQRELDAANERYAPPARARRFAILDHEFTVDAGTLTPTLKIRRQAVIDRYAGVIDELYA